jgi:hypothetical protein
LNNVPLAVHQVGCPAAANEVVLRSVVSVPVVELITAPVTVLSAKLAV